MLVVYASILAYGHEIVKRLGLGLGTWDPGPGTWDLGTGTFDMGHGTWRHGTWDLGIE